MKIDLSGRVVLITGSSRGIGRAAALLFAEHGADLALNYRENTQAAESLLVELKKYPVRARIYRADVADEHAVGRMIEHIVTDFGRLDVLVNNAGIWKEAAIVTMTSPELDEMIDVNLKSIFYCCRAAVPHLAQRGGSIINIASTAGQRGEAFHSHYAATKGAIISLTKSLAPELVGDKIRVNCVAPGWVNTDMSAEELALPDAQRHLRLIPLGRPASPDEIAGAIVFLASDWATFITGEILNVNGGAVLCG
ncbi:MAG: SDR family oxidoreductase [candidate division Zixibacteria bacterium]|nr:SDR family oxidoreductase [candidate division Zixibacteria bacterium]